MVWIVSICYSDSAISAHGFDEVRRPPYSHPLHRKVLKHFIYIYDGNIIHSEVVLGLSHAIAVVKCVYPVVKWIQPAQSTYMALMK